MLCNHHDIAPSLRPVTIPAQFAAVSSARNLDFIETIYEPTAFWLTDAARRLGGCSSAAASQSHRLALKQIATPETKLKSR
jgi:hypothetical protein